MTKSHCLPGAFLCPCACMLHSFSVTTADPFSYHYRPPKVHTLFKFLQSGSRIWRAREIFREDCHYGKLRVGSDIWHRIIGKKNFSEYNIVIQSRSQWPRGLRRTVYDRSPAEIVCSNLTGGMDVCLL